MAAQDGGLGRDLAGLVVYRCVDGEEAVLGEMGEGQRRSRRGCVGHALRRFRAGRLRRESTRHGPRGGGPSEARGGARRHNASVMSSGARGAGGHGACHAPGAAGERVVARDTGLSAGAEDLQGPCPRATSDKRRLSGVPSGATRAAAAGRPPRPLGAQVTVQGGSAARRLAGRLSHVPANAGAVTRCRVPVKRADRISGSPRAQQGPH